MGTVAAALRKYKALRQNLPSIIRETLESETEEIARLNRTQLSQGETSKGGKFPKYKSLEYARLKNNISPLPGLGNPDLNLSGRYSGKIDASLKGSDIHFHSSDPKARFIEMNYGADLIYGLSENTRKEFINNTLRKKFINNIKSFLSK